MSASLKVESINNNVFYAQTHVENNNNNVGASNKKTKVQKKMSFQDFCKINQEPAKEPQKLVKTKVERIDPKVIYNGYVGEIENDYFDLQFVNINDVASKILFSQDTVSDFSADGKCDLPISDLADQLFLGFKTSGALDIVDNGDGTFTSLDNRRLLIAKRIGVVDRTYGIWVKVHSANQKLSYGLQKRFNAFTWGEAVAVRVGKNIKGYTNYPTILDEGRKKKSQNIALTFDPSSYDYSDLHQDDVKNLQANAKMLQATI